MGPRIIEYSERNRLLREGIHLLLPLINLHYRGLFSAIKGNLIKHFFSHHKNTEIHAKKFQYSMIIFKGISKDLK